MSPEYQWLLYSEFSGVPSYTHKISGDLTQVLWCPLNISGDLTQSSLVSFEYQWLSYSEFSGVPGRSVW